MIQQCMHNHTCEQRQRENIRHSVRCWKKQRGVLIVRRRVEAVISCENPGDIVLVPVSVVWQALREGEVRELPDVSVVQDRSYDLCKS